MSQELFIENSTELNPFLVIALQTNTAGNFDQVFEDCYLGPQLGDCLCSRRQINHLIGLFFEEGTFFVGGVLIEYLERIE